MNYGPYKCGAHIRGHATVDEALNCPKVRAMIAKEVIAPSIKKLATMGHPSDREDI